MVWLMITQYNFNIIQLDDQNLSIHWWSFIQETSGRSDKNNDFSSIFTHSHSSLGFRFVEKFFCHFSEVSKCVYFDLKRPRLARICWTFRERPKRETRFLFILFFFSFLRLGWAVLACIVSWPSLQGVGQREGVKERGGALPFSPLPPSI